MENLFKEAEEYLSCCYNRSICLTRDFTEDEIWALKMVSPSAVQCGLSFEETKDVIIALSNCSYKPKNAAIELKRMFVRLDSHPHARKVTDKMEVLSREEK